MTTLTIEERWGLEDLFPALILRDSSSSSSDNDADDGDGDENGGGSASENSSLLHNISEGGEDDRGSDVIMDAEARKPSYSSL